MTALSESCSAALLEFFVPAALSDGLVAGRFESVVVLAELDDLPAVADFSPLDVLAADLSEVLAALEVVGDLSIVLDFEVVDLEVEDWEGLVVEDLALDDLLESALLAGDLLLSDLVLLLVELLVESFDFSVVVDCPLTGAAVRVAASIATPAPVVSRRSHAAKSVFICNSSHGWKAMAPCEIRDAASVLAKASHSLCPCAAGSAKVVSLKESRLRKRKKKRELQRPKNLRCADRRREELPMAGGTAPRLLPRP